MLSPSQLVELTRRYQTTLARLAALSEQQLQRLWDELGSWDEADVERFETLAMPVGQATINQAAKLAAGYIGLAVGTSYAVDVTHLFDTLDLRSPFLGYWASLQRGEPWEKAITTGRTRAGTIGFNAARDGSREAAQQVDDQEPQIIGWERLLDGSSCEWCAMVATQLYHSAQSANFGHDRCGCDPVPVFGKTRPARVINRGLLSNLHNTGADRTGYVDAHGNPVARPADADVEEP